MHCARFRNRKVAGQAVIRKKSHPTVSLPGGSEHCYEAAEAGLGGQALAVFNLANSELSENLYSCIYLDVTGCTAGDCNPFTSSGPPDTTMSTRRLRARPSGVALSAFGIEEPNPATSMLDARTPWPIR
jgi:hypothetical protein